MKKAHITVCICTYKRPLALQRLLESLSAQRTDDRFELSASIVDNDVAFSAEPIVEQFQSNNRMDIHYAHAPEHNLALLRNISVDNSKGDYVAFIDDDEYAVDNWLLLLLDTIRVEGVSGAFGPVMPAFATKPPRWIEKGRFCERARHRTGFRLQGQHTRTGNALIRRDILLDPANRFDLKFRLGAEDDSLFERLIKKGHEFAWCDEAVVFEEIPPQRLRARYFIKRARLIGYMSYAYSRDEKPPSRRGLALLSACAKTALYAAVSPFALLTGYHRFIRIVTRLSYNSAVIGTALGLLKIDRRGL
jgi:succinoglycan biosynthesis protein ExoM